VQNKPEAMRTVRSLLRKVPEGDGTEGETWRRSRKRKEVSSYYRKQETRYDVIGIEKKSSSSVREKESNYPVPASRP